MRLATTVTIAELHGLMNVEFRRNHEAEHQGAEAEAPHCSRPSWSSPLRKKIPGNAHRQGGSTGAGFGTQLLGGRAKRLGKLSTLAEDAMLSTPDQLDRLCT